MRKVPGALIWESGTGQRNRRMGGREAAVEERWGLEGEGTGGGKG